MILIIVCKICMGILETGACVWSLFVPIWVCFYLGECLMLRALYSSSSSIYISLKDTLKDTIFGKMDGAVNSSR